MSVRQLPDPAGAPPPGVYDGANYADNPYLIGPGLHMFNHALEIDPTGTWLLQIARNAGGSNPLRLYRRTGDTWAHTYTDTYRPGGQPIIATWSPDSKWVIIAPTGLLNSVGQIPTDGVSSTEDYLAAVHAFRLTQRLQVWRRDGDALTFAGLAPPGVWANNTLSQQYNVGGQLAFDPTGAWLAVAGYEGFTGLLRFAGGELSIASGRTIDSYDYLLIGDDTGFYADVVANSAFSQAWNPADPSLLVRLDTSYRPLIYRRDGDQLVYDRYLPDVAGYNAVWHPSGKVIAVNQLNGCFNLQVVLHTWPACTPLATLGGYDNSIGYGGNLKFDPTGALLAGGYGLIDGDPARWYGLRIAAFAPDGGGVPAGGYGEYDGYTVMSSPDTSSGHLTTFGRDAGGDLILASACEDQISTLGNAEKVPDTWASPWGFRTFRIDGTPTSTSVLHQRMPDGSTPLVGVPGQPLSIALGDGAIRTWPGAAEALWQCGDDGVLRKVIG